MDVLQAINKGRTKPTRLILVTNTSWDVLFRAIPVLLENNYIVNLGPDTKDKRSKERYGITDTGKEVLRYLNSTKGKGLRHLLSLYY